MAYSEDNTILDFMFGDTQFKDEFINQSRLEADREGSVTSPLPRPHSKARTSSPLPRLPLCGPLLPFPWKLLAEVGAGGAGGRGQDRGREREAADNFLSLLAVASSEELTWK